MNPAKTAYTVLLGVILFLGLLLRFAGLSESTQLHPDENSIRRWLDNMQYEKDTNGRFSMGANRSYPGGFFVLTTAARSWIARPAERLGARWRYFTRQSDRCGPIGSTTTADFGRICNVWMGTLTILLVALAVRRTTSSRPAALLAAAFMAFEPYSIEHAHYLETDIAMLMMCTLSLYAMLHYLRDRTSTWWCISSLATGFAIGTKYPVGLLVFPLFASLRLPPGYHDRPLRAKFRWCLSMLLLGGGLVAVGFIAACPDSIRPHTQMQAVLACGNAAWQETSQCVGQARSLPFSRQLLNLRNFFSVLGAVSWGYLLLMSAGIILTLRDRRIRPYWPVLLLFPFLYLSYLVLLAPWTRTQEFLPLAPCLALLASVTCSWIATRPYKSARFALVFLLLLSVWPMVRQGCSMSSIFGWEDTRRLAARDLSSSYPVEAPLLLEKYSYFSDRGVTDRSQVLGKDKYFRTRFLKPDEDPSSFPPYLMNNTDYQGRGAIDPRTGKMQPRFARRQQFLEEEGIRIGAWGGLDSPAPHPTFRAPDMICWRTPETIDRSGNEARELGVPLPRPSFIVDTRALDEGHETFFKGGPRVGARKALLVDELRREVALGGPGTLDEGLYCILTTVGQGTSVRLHGLGRSTSVDVSPANPTIVRLKRPWWRPRLARYEHLVFREEPLAATGAVSSCLMHIAFSPLEAAAILLDEGHALQAASFLRDENAPEARQTFWQAFSGKRQAMIDAERLLADWERMVGDESLSGSDRLANGIPLDIWEDFARLRMVPLGASIPLGKGPVALGVLLPIPGTAQTLAASIRPDGHSTNGPVSPIFHVGGEVYDAKREGPSDAPCTYAKIIIPTARSPLQVGLSPASPADGTLCYAEYSWHWRDMLAFRIRQLREALGLPPGKS